MELAVRKDSDRFVKQGAYGALQMRLRRQSGKLAEIPTVVLSAFDRSTRLLPFLFYDTRNWLRPRNGVATVRANARQFAVNVLPIIEEIERAGITSHNGRGQSGQLRSASLFSGVDACRVQRSGDTFDKAT